MRGNATVTIQGKAEVWQNVHGGGEKASVGRYYVAQNQTDVDTYHVRIGMPCYLKAGGKCTVYIQDAAVIGNDDIADSGDVFGAGQGVTPIYNNTEDDEARSKRMVYKNADHNDDNRGDFWDYYVDEDGNADATYVWEYFATKDDYLLYVETLGRASETDVVIGGKRETTGESAGNITPSGSPTVKGTVYGGSESGFVFYSTEVNIPGGTVNGDAFGGGKGLSDFVEAGRVKRNTNLTVSGGTVEGNVYGGGSLGDVGTITKTDDYNYTWKQNDGANANVTGYNKNATATNTGICNVTISGGTIGVDVNSSANHASGHVFGAGKGSDDTWWCEKAMTFATNVSISAGTVYGNVYGGGEVGRVEDDVKVVIGVANATGTVAPDIKGDVFGAGAGIETHGYSALVRGNASVTIQGTTQVGGSVYGGGEIASVGRFIVVGGLPTKPDTGGTCIVNIKDNAKIGTSGTTHHVFGACKGVDPATVSERKSMQLLANAPEVASLWSHYNDDENSPYIWRYYQTEQDYLDFLKTLALTSNPHVTIGGTWTSDGETETITPSGSPSVYGSVYGGGQRGVTLGAVDVNMLGGTVEQDVYGGGALADTNAGNWDVNGYVVATSLNEGEAITDLYTRSGTEAPYTYTKETNSGATISSGTYYRQQATWAHTEGSAYFTTTVDLTGGTIKGNAYGGGLGQIERNAVAADPDHGIDAVSALASIEALVYGDVMLKLNETVEDNLKGCVVKGFIFGCNNQNGTPKGTTTVYIYKTQRDGQTRITNGDEVTTAKVWGTKDENGEYNLSSFDVKAVYGGGNLSAYEPVDLVNGSTRVIIDGCEQTSIGQVYGGGNAASTPATYVEVNGTFEIGELFGGGNGKDRIIVNGVEKANPGANVGFYDYSGVESTYDTKEERLGTEFISQYVYGTGKASLNVYGGTIRRVFGGSNTKGNVRVTAITLMEETGGCPFHVDEAYGGGKSAPMDAEAMLLMACIPGLKEVYGGAQAADIQDNVTLTITNGTFDRVFGGNNLSGTIRGKITVNIQETGCRPILIGELYGGGNEAGYSVYGYKQMTEGTGVDAHLVWKPRVSATDITADGDVDTIADPYDDPEVNVKSFTSIGSIYGGGYGSGAVMVGSPTVSVNVTKGEHAETVINVGAKVKDSSVIYDGYDGYDDAKAYPIPSHTANSIGAINKVFGGGNAAEVKGNTTVNIGTQNGTDEYMVIYIREGEDLPTLPEGESYYTRSGSAGSYTYTETNDTTAQPDTTYYKKYVVMGADIRGNVYGGGNNAAVRGNTNVVIGTQATP